MANSGVAALNSASYSSRNPPYYVETREYRYNRDDLRKKGHNLQPASPHSSSKATFTQPNQSYPHVTQESPHRINKREHSGLRASGSRFNPRSSEYEDIVSTKATYPQASPSYPRVPHHIDKREHSDLRASGFNRRSSEYEDIYNTRRFQVPMRTISTREERNSCAVQIGIRGGWRASKGSSDMRDSRGMIRNSGHQRNMEERREFENIENARYSRDTRDVRDITGIRYFDETKNKREDMKYLYTPHVADKKNIRDTRYTEEQTRINDTRQNPEETRDSVDNWTEEIKRARQTSFPRDPRQEAFNERPSLPRNNVNNNTMYHNVETTPRPQDPPPVNIELKNFSETSKRKQPPPVSAKPIRSTPQTTRPDSPAKSVHSSVSDVSSHMTRQSAASEISVKSILKKPRVGRVVLKEEPSSFTVLAIFSCILCFPFGIYALVKSEQVKSSVEENDYATALSSSKKVKHFCIVITIAYLGLFFIGGALLAKYLITGKLF